MALPKNLPPSWQTFFQDQSQQAYLKNVLAFVASERQSQVVYPPADKVWQAFELTPLDQVRVVIMGQDPYHGEGQAHGLSFSVQPHIKTPPSLKNIFKELHRDLGLDVPDSGNLDTWASQGVLLLNSCLTVRAGEPGSHAKQGWESFTQACIDYINAQKEHVVFLAWGRFAHEVCAKVDTTKHCVIKTSHPSPLGASKQGKDFAAFLGSGCFSQANEYLQSTGQQVIDWNLAANQSQNLGFDF